MTDIENYLENYNDKNKTYTEDDKYSYMTQYVRGILLFVDKKYVYIALSLIPLISTIICIIKINNIVGF